MVWAGSSAAERRFYTAIYLSEHLENTGIFGARIVCRKYASVAVGCDVAHSWDTDPPENHFPPDLAARMREVQALLGAPPSVSYAPGRTLFVAVSWPSGADPTIYFTDPSAALAAAAALSPAPDINNPALIVVGPGRFTQAVALVSNVHILGCASRGCALSGAITWSPGVGVNAAQTNTVERVYVEQIGFGAALTVDARGKAAGQSTLDLRDVDVNADLTFRGRGSGGPGDYLQMWDSVCGGTNWVIDGAVPFFNNGVQLGAGSVTVSNCPAGVGFVGAIVFSTLNLVNTPGAGSGGGNKFSDVNVDSTSVFGPVAGSKTGVVTVAAGGVADLRCCEWFNNANLQGAGAIDRSVWRTIVGPTNAGANVVTLAPAYIDASYNVHVTQTAGTATPVKVSSKQAGQFTLIDAAGGNTFDVTIVKE